MKKLLLLLMMLVTFVGCDDKDLFDEGLVKDNLCKYQLTEEFEVPIQEGYNTVVTFNGEEIYFGNVSTKIDVPIYSEVHTRTPALQWHFVINNDVNKWYYQTSRQGILMFEDVPNGDNDYNDFVCWIREEIGVNLNGKGVITGLSMNNVRIKPLAMGNTLPMQFGFEIVNLNSGNTYIEHIFADDVRSKYFDNVPGFINTDNPIINPSKLPEDGHGFNGNWSNPSLENGAFGVNWFIIVNGNKYYTADSALKLANSGVTYDKLLTQNMVPFGLFVQNVNYDNFQWCNEKVKIWDAYPNFLDWVEGKDVNPFGRSNKDLLFSF